MLNSRHGKKSLTCAIVAVMVAFGASSTEAADTLKFATEAAFPPFNERAADGSIVGFDVDIGLALCEKMNRDCEFMAQDWDGMIPGLLALKYDAIVASMSITEERQKKINFTNKYYQTPSKFVGREGLAIDINDPELGGLVIGTYPGTTQCYLEKFHADAEYRIFDTADALYLDLVAGRIDAVLVDSIAADFGLIRTEQGAGMAFLSEGVVDQECFGEGIGIGIRKEDTELLDAMNEALAAIRADGTYDKIMYKYFEYDIYGQ